MDNLTITPQMYRQILVGIIYAILKADETNRLYDKINRSLLNLL